MNSTPTNHTPPIDAAAIALGLSLYPPSHHNAPPGTSKVAAARIAPHSRTMLARVYQHIASCGATGATADEGEAALLMKCQTYTPRRRELAKLGLVVDSGRRRMTRSGCPAAVWVTPEHATTPSRSAEEVNS